ncbi:hypothetical protein T261_0736 [Streptomyces lydicus]|nr:hypothetical protein T261_0736 [Streptomyces lydicus]
MRLRPLTTDPIPADDMPDWVPRHRLLTVQAGVHWDAIRMPVGDALRVHEILGPDSGPVLASAFAGIGVFLLEPPGSTADWSVYRTQLVRPGAHVEIPPATVRHGRDMRWLVLPGHGTTDADALKEALADRSTGRGHLRALRQPATE